MVKKIIGLILGLFMMGLVITGISFYFFKAVVANPNTYHTALQETHAGVSVQTEVENALIDLMLVNNMPTYWVRDLVDVDLMQTRLHQNIEGVHAALINEEILDNDQYVDQLITVFEQRIQSYLEAENKYLDESDLENLELIKTEIKTIILNQTMVLNPGFLAKSGTVSKISTVIGQILSLPVLPFIVMLMMSLVVFQQLISFKQWTQGLKHTGIGVMAGGLGFVILGLSGILSGFYKNPMIQEGYLRNLVAYLGEHFFMIFLKLGLIVTLIGVVFLVPYLIKSYQEFVKEQ